MIDGLCWLEREEFCIGSDVRGGGRVDCLE